ncbi:MAG: carboxynorspermidine decarboxylase [Kiritimatiellae bacterium]|nr:carboxynorspermidine decarboxylase [Kiritimatiellia bacterium]
MDAEDFVKACREETPSPCYVVWEEALCRNLEVLRRVKDRTGCRILLALKAFAMFRVFPLLREVLDGTCASSVDEARLGREEFGGEVHVYAPAYSETDLNEILSLADHVTFNSFGQWHRFRRRVLSAPRPPRCGLRINPECSSAPVPLYDPCGRYSRLGIRRDEFAREGLDGVSGLLFHTLCEQNADALERTLRAVEEKFGEWLPGLQWINFGGGHHITREDYDVDLLCRLILSFRERHGVPLIYLEPGEAVALKAGVLVATVLDVVHNEMPIAILDTSAACHMPDVLEMPYRPRVVGAGEPGRLPHTCRLAGISCLAGDVIGDYSFEQPLRPGDRIVFEDMAHYTMVKNTTFNGVRLPSLAIYRNGHIEVVRSFSYEDYRSRLS